VRHLLFERDDLVELLRDLGIVAGEIFGKPDREIAAPEAAEGSDELPAVKPVAGGKVVHSSLLRTAPRSNLQCNSFSKHCDSKECARAH
jgi:hypothetical protein